MRPKPCTAAFLTQAFKFMKHHKGVMHAKVAVIDSHWATIGSSNLDPFSLLLSLEANIVIDDGPLCQSIKAQP